MKTKPLIALKNIVKTYTIGDKKTEVLKKISLTVDKGELLAIVGASGSGKSTLMNIMGLLDRGDSGEHWLNSRNIGTFSPDELAQARNRDIGFVFQQFHLLPRYTAAQNVALPLIYRGKVSTEDTAERVHLALKHVGMHRFKKHLPSQLSGGQQQRVAIARALVGNPAILLADEPTGSLDSRTGEEIMHLFLELHAEGRTILMITHDAKVAAHAQRQITMIDGQIFPSPQKWGEGALSADERLAMQSSQ